MSAVASNAPVTGEDVELLARTVLAETDNQPFSGKLASAYSVVTRAQIAAAYVKSHGRAHPEFGTGSVGSACIVPYQYSCWNTKDAARPRMLTLAQSDARLQIAKAAALNAIHGLMPNPVPGCTHYYNPKAVVQPPSWALDAAGKLKPPTFVIGDHHFYRNVT